MPVVIALMLVLPDTIDLSADFFRALDIDNFGFFKVFGYLSLGFFLSFFGLCDFDFLYCFFSYFFGCCCRRLLGFAARSFLGAAGFSAGFSTGFSAGFSAGSATISFASLILYESGRTNVWLNDPDFAAKGSELFDCYCKPFVYDFLYRVSGVLYVPFNEFFNS